jgi:predicted PurR-regulated permease PerM
MIKQTDKFIEAAPALIKDFRSQDSFTGRFIREYGLESQVDSVSKQLSDRINNAGGETFTAAQKAGTSLFSVIAILVLTFMMLIEGPGRLKFMLGTFPERKQAVAKRLADDMYKVVKGFVNGQVILAVIASIIIFPALLVLDIGYPIALMVIVFICGLIPLVGHTVGAIIVSIVALFTSPTAALLILTYYIAYQQIENYFIQPKIQANATNMSPLLVFMAVIVGISFGGIAGGLFAIPLAGVIRILVLEYLRERELLGEQEFLEETTASTK